MLQPMGLGQGRCIDGNLTIVANDVPSTVPKDFSNVDNWLPPVHG